MEMPLYIHRITTIPKLGKCDVTFKEGLNVIYANKLPGFSHPPNSVGKTTVINLIDFCLSKTNFLNDTQKRDKEIKEFFENVSAVLEIKIKGVKYTIVRSILEDDQVYIYDFWNSQGIKKDKPIEILDLKQYRVYLEKTIYGDRLYDNNQKIITIRSLLKYIFREQKQGFIKFDAIKPNEKGTICSKRLDFLLGKINPELSLLRDELTILTDDINSLNSKKNILNNHFNEIDDKNLSSLKKDKKQLEKEKKEVEDKLNSKKDELLSSEQTKNILFNQKDDINKKITIQNDEIFLIRNRLENYTLCINEIDNEVDKLNNITSSKELLDSFPQKRCPLYTNHDIDAKYDYCPLIEKNKTDDNHELLEARYKLLSYEKKDIKKAKLNLEKTLKEKESRRNDLDKELKIIDEKIRNHNKSFLEIYNKLNEKFHNLIFNIKEVDNKINNIKIISDLKVELRDKKSLKKEKKEKYDELDLELKTGISINFSKIYNQVIHFITRNNRDGSIDPDKLKPQVYFKKRNVKDSGAAMGVVENIAYDLALLKLSLIYQKNEKYNNHPLVLIHDSPKIRDIDIDMYNRIFDYMICLEKSFKFKDYPFQYIITTLDISESVINDKSLTVLELDNSGDKGKLFERTIDV